VLPQNLIRSKFIEQRLGVLQIASVETLGETAVDFGEHRARFVAATLQTLAAMIDAAFVRGVYGLRSWIRGWAED
jgi:hypothetical protein